MRPNPGRFDWSQETWHHIHQAVAEESERTEIASRFLPLYGPMPEALTVASDSTELQGKTLIVDEAATVPLVEIWVELVLTPQQVMEEMDLHAAATLGTYAARFLSDGQDTLIFQGQSATRTDPLFTSGRVRLRSGPAGDGLFNAPLPADQVLEVASQSPGRPVYRERTLEAVTRGISILEAQGQYGPYALVLQDVPYGDAFDTLPDTLITAAQRLEPMVDLGFYGTGALPGPQVLDRPAFGGLLLSLGGNTMDLVVGFDSAAAFLQEDEAGLYRFRVTKRFALRLKDPSAVIKLLFGAGS